MVLVHEYPLSMIDYAIFNKFMKVVSSFYKKINRQIVNEDCLTIYKIKNKSLKNTFTRLYENYNNNGYVKI